MSSYSYRWSAAQGSVMKEILHAVGRNRIEIQKPNLKSKNDSGSYQNIPQISVYFKTNYITGFIQTCLWCNTITSAHSEWLLFLTNLWSGTKVIFLSDIIATCHCMVCTFDIVTLHMFCVHPGLQRMWFVDCSYEYFSCVFRLTIQTKFRNPLWNLDIQI